MGRSEIWREHEGALCLDERALVITIRNHQDVFEPGARNQTFTPCAMGAARDLRSVSMTFPSWKASGVLRGRCSNVRMTGTAWSGKRGLCVPR
jgi:hypothetical protein